MDLTNQRLDVLLTLSKAAALTAKRQSKVLDDLRKGLRALEGRLVPLAAKLEDIERMSDRPEPEEDQDADLD